MHIHPYFEMDSTSRRIYIANICNPYKVVTDKGVLTKGKLFAFINYRPLNTPLTTWILLLFYKLHLSCEMHLFCLWLMLLCVANVDFDIKLINIVDFVQTLFGLRVREEIAVCTPSLSNLFHTKEHAKQVRWLVFCFFWRIIFVVCVMLY